MGEANSETHVQFAISRLRKWRLQGAFTASPSNCTNLIGRKYEFAGFVILELVLSEMYFSIIGESSVVSVPIKKVNLITVSVGID